MKGALTRGEYAHCYFYLKCVLLAPSVDCYYRGFSEQVCSLVPRGLAHPAEGESCICANLD